MVWHKAVDDPRRHPQHQHPQKPLEPPASPLGLGARGSQVWWNCGWFWMKIESFTSRVVGQPHNPKSVRHTLRSARSGWHGSSSFCKEGMAMIEILMETGFYLISKGEIFPIVSFPFFSSSTSCSSLLLLLTMAGLPTGLPECRLTRVWKRLTWRNIYKSWKSRL